MAYGFISAHLSGTVRVAVAGVHTSVDRKRFSERQVGAVATVYDP
jgi:hypothetical protein